LRGIDFSTIGDSFADQLKHLEDLLEVGVIEPSERFGRIVEILGKAGSAAPGITGALAGLDVTTAEGRGAAIKALRALLSGFDDLQAIDFGQLAHDQFIDVVKQLLGILLSDAEIGPVFLPRQPDLPGW